MEIKCNDESRISIGERNCFQLPAAEDGKRVMRAAGGALSFGSAVVA